MTHMVLEGINIRPACLWSAWKNELYFSLLALWGMFYKESLDSAAADSNCPTQPQPLHTPARWTRTNTNQDFSPDQHVWRHSTAVKSYKKCSCRQIYTMRALFTLSIPHQNLEFIKTQVCVWFTGQRVLKDPLAQTRLFFAEMLSVLAFRYSLTVMHLRPGADILITDPPMSPEGNHCLNTTYVRTEQWDFNSKLLE